MHAQEWRYIQIVSSDKTNLFLFYKFKIIASNINSKRTIPEIKAVLNENKETKYITQKGAKSEEMDDDTSEDEEDE